MNKLIITTLIYIIIFSACKNKINTYENTLGIRPSSLAEIDTANYTEIQWEDTLKNFGSINEGDSALIKFKFKNKGKTALFILDVTPSCGCTLTDYPHNAILPRDQGIITATFNTQGHPGNVTKNIMVKTNTINKMVHKLEFSGEVIKKEAGNR
jgi:Protein of unknown function (DUF1573)